MQESSEKEGSKEGATGSGEASESQEAPKTET